MKTIKYSIHHHGEPAAGLNGYRDNISICIESGDPGGDDGEFEEFMRESLLEWFDGADVREKL